MNTLKIQAKVIEGKRKFRSVKMVIDPALTELNFIEGEGGQPTQARVCQKIWNQRLGYYRSFDQLVVQDSIEIIED